MLLMWWLKYEVFLCQSFESRKKKSSCKIGFPFVCFHPDLFVSIDRILYFFQSRERWGRRESLQEVRESPQHHLTALCLRVRPIEKPLWLSDVNAAVLLSHTTRGLQSLGLISASLIKVLLFHPCKLQNNSFSMPFLIEQQQGKRCL